MRQQAFTSIRTEGGLFPPDFLQRLTGAVSGVPGLTSESYHLAGNEKLNEAASRAWNRLLGIWNVFYSASVPEGEAGTTLTREKWLLPLFAELGYGRLLQSRTTEVNGKSYPVSHAWQHVPIHLVGRNIDLDYRTAKVAGAARTSPHSLLQELLNRREESQWGFVSNGLKLRLLRDNRSLTRQAYIEFDLVAMMEGQAFSDFVILWLMCHQSRVEAVPPEPCWLEKWATEAREQGTRALNELRSGVKDAIESLGRGFLKHAANKPLLEKLRAGSLDKQDYYRQLLRVVYRLIFLFVAESRDLLLVSKPGSPATERYSQFYSIARLRDLSASRRGTPHGDLWQSLQVVVRGLSSERGLAELGLPALGSFLWSASATPDLGSCQVANTNLLDAIRALAYRMDGNIRRRVDWRNLGPEELGSVYESLLELHPVLNSAAATFDLSEAPGHERKETGSYYTPTSLVDCLLDSALDPVLDEAAKSADPERAILHLKVCDPACGSGHFLIAAAHRIARRLAAIRTGDAEASPEAVRRALRDVIGHCLYGVDMNEMAVELCKVNLWLEALDPGKPLSFLDQRIRFGNALLGATPALLRAGIPDEAFEPIEGDDPEQCRLLKRANRLERQGFQNLVNAEAWKRIGDLASGIAALEEIDDSTLEGVHRLEARYAELVRSSEYQCGRLWADTWCAAFVWPKTRDAEPLTEDMFRIIERNPMAAPEALRNDIQHIAKQHRFFHWHLAFPEVFHVPPANEPLPDGPGWTGGFDVVLGNPPWERISLKEREFFSGRSPEIAADSNSGTRAQKIAELEISDPSLHQEFIRARNCALRTKHFLSSCGRYPASAVGDINTYALFTDLYNHLANKTGRCGIITQTQLVTEKTYSGLLRELLQKKRVASCFCFENERTLFRGAHHSTRFALLTLGPDNATVDCATALWEIGWLADRRRRYTLTVEDMHRFNPDTWSIPQFRAGRDAELATRIYAQNPLFGAANTMREQTSASRVMHDKDDAAVLSWDFDEAVTKGKLPIIESKLIEHFNHRAGTYEGVTTKAIKDGYPRDSTESELNDPCFFVRPRKWVGLHDAPKRFCDFESDWILHVRKIANNIMFRTITAAITPKHPNNGSAAWIRNDGFCVRDYLCLLGVLNSFVFDYLARQKIAGLNVSSYHLMQLPVPLLPSEAEHDWQDAVVLRVFELTYCSFDLVGLAQDLGNEINSSTLLPPFRWNQERRDILQSEVDAIVALAYGLERPDLEWVLDAQDPSETFRVLKQNEMAKYGEFVTRKRTMESYDFMVETLNSGRPFRSRLAPPPGDARCAHPKKKIGVFAFGSLIHDPGEELRAKTVVKIKSKTPFPVEYGRYSGKTRGGAPTLVPHSNGAPVAAEIFVMADDVSVEDATNMLWRRETGRVGTVEVYRRGVGADSVLVERVVDNPWVETVLYTDFNAAGKIAKPTAAELSARAIESVAKANDGKDGITYLCNAISVGIETPLTGAYKAEILRQTSTADLQAAVAKARNERSAFDAATND